ncbi:MAG: 2OG-Fe(II) oxygenase family protein [Pseudomonadota bacterium]
MSALRTVDYTAANAADLFTESIKATGFAVLRHHPLCTTRLVRMYADWAHFFSSPTRHEYTHDKAAPDGNQHGYFPPAQAETAVGHAVADIKEYFHATLGGVLPEKLAHDVDRHRSEALALARILLGWLDAALPPDCRQAEHVVLADVASLEDSLLRVLRYPPLAGDEPAGSMRAAAHEDINLITLLPVADQPGLEVQLHGGDWVAVDGAAGDLIINTGDMLQEYSGGAIPSTTHRVVNPDDGGNVARIAIPFFVAPTLSTRLSPRYSAGEYLRQRIRDNYTPSATA